MQPFTQYFRSLSLYHWKKPSWSNECIGSKNAKEKLVMFFMFLGVQMQQSHKVFDPLLKVKNVCDHCKKHYFDCKKMHFLSWAYLAVNRMKRTPQNLQGNGLWPVWIRSCSTKVLLWLNERWQNLQVKGFCPVWILSCLLQLDEDANSFPQNLQECLPGGAWLWLVGTDIGCAPTIWICTVCSPFPTGRK